MFRSTQMSIAIKVADAAFYSFNEPVSPPALLCGFNRVPWEKVRVRPNVGGRDPQSSLERTSKFEERLMCPACLTTAALIAAGSGSAGGLTAFFVRRWRRRARG
jgi:hypothetical protein